jgi:hypothetical protein
MSTYEENAAILQKIASDGKDLKSPRPVDFCHIFPDKGSADAFSRMAEAQGFAIAVNEVERETDPWDVIASKLMTPTCGAITSIEERLDAIARLFQGRADGWGFLNV